MTITTWAIVALLILLLAHGLGRCAKQRICTSLYSTAESRGVCIGGQS